MSRKIFFHRVLNRGRRACPACFLCYFLHAAKSNNPFPFRELPDKQKVCPCRGSTLRVLLLPCRELRGFANLEAAHTGGGFAQAASRLFPAAKPPNPPPEPYRQNAQKTKPLFGQLFDIAPYFPFLQKKSRKSLDKSLALV